MRLADIALLSFQALRRYPLRTAMLLTAIAIGVAAVVTLTAVGEGARRYVTGQFSELGTQLLIVLPGKAETAGSGIHSASPHRTDRAMRQNGTGGSGTTPSPRSAINPARQSGARP